MRKNGERLLICYEGTTEDGEIFDRCSESEPLEIALGVRAVPVGVENALKEMALGEEKTVTLSPEEAYGEHDPNRVCVYPYSYFKDSENLKPGDMLLVPGGKNGDRPLFPKVVSNEDGFIRLDYNHPMAGKSVTYRVKIVEELTR